MTSPLTSLKEHHDEVQKEYQTMRAQEVVGNYVNMILRAVEQVVQAEVAKEEYFAKSLHNAILTGFTLKFVMFDKKGENYHKLLVVMNYANHANCECIECDMSQTDVDRIPNQYFEETFCALRKAISGDNVKISERYDTSPAYDYLAIAFINEPPVDADNEN